MFQKLYDLFGLKEVFPRSSFLTQSIENHCTANATFQDMCIAFGSFFLVMNKEGLDKVRYQDHHKSVKE